MSCILVIKDIDKQYLDKQSLLHIFDKFGSLKSIDISKSKGYAYIKYLKDDEAYKVYKRIKDNFEVFGKRVRVEYKDVKKESPEPQHHNTARYYQQQPVQPQMSHYYDDRRGNGHYSQRPPYYATHRQYSGVDSQQHPQPPYYYNQRSNDSYRPQYYHYKEPYHQYQSRGNHTPQPPQPYYANRYNQQYGGGYQQQYPVPQHYPSSSHHHNQHHHHHSTRQRSSRSPTAPSQPSVRHSRKRSKSRTRSRSRTRTRSRTSTISEAYSSATEATPEQRHHEQDRISRTPSPSSPTPQPQHKTKSHKTKTKDDKKSRRPLNISHSPISDEDDDVVVDTKNTNLLKRTQPESQNEPDMNKAAPSHTPSPSLTKQPSKSNHRIKVSPTSKRLRTVSSDLKITIKTTSILPVEATRTSTSNGDGEIVDDEFNITHVLHFNSGKSSRPETSLNDRFDKRNVELTQSPHRQQYQQQQHECIFNEDKRVIEHQHNTIDFLDIHHDDDEDMNLDYESNSRNVGSGDGAIGSCTTKAVNNV